MYNGIKCGDIEGENGLCYCGHMGLDDSAKEYVVDNEADIQMAPDIPLTLFLLPSTRQRLVGQKKHNYKGKRQHTNYT